MNSAKDPITHIVANKFVHSTNKMELSVVRYGGGGRESERKKLKKEMDGDKMMRP